MAKENVFAYLKLKFNGTKNPIIVHVNTRGSRLAVILTADLSEAGQGRKPGVAAARRERGQVSSHMSDSSTLSSGSYLT